MFNILKKDKPATDGAADKAPKKGLYQRFQEAKNRPISDEEVRKYTGRSKDEIIEWGKTREGVAGNQAAGSLTAGGHSGFGTAAGAGEGLGGWGPGANARLKFPPTPAGAKKTEPKELETDDD
ncbi:hypothetical protein QBC47DRAFT_389453 [Echria macrotheca]|uniref:Uncharacterized protein n=1 Tax=Echria macrotheca TaxID=438768 RepID=A0AAJ0B5P8_9PEZI|nr:hypothetical protein QBC47DRAFT_389453 [Echria macrotheca]